MRLNRRLVLQSAPVAALLLESVVPVSAQVLDAKPGSRAVVGRVTLNLRDFDFLVATIAANYAGWHTKVTPATRADLDKLTSTLRARATTASDDEFARIAREWIGFFKDGHVQFAQLAPATLTSSNGRNTAVPSAAATGFDWSEQNVRARLAFLGDQRDPLEGIWSIGGNRYRIGVLRTGSRADRFTGVVLATAADNWRPGQIKAEFVRAANGELSVDYRRGDHGIETVAGEVGAAGAAIKLKGWGVWTREVPELVDTDIIDRTFAAGTMFLKRVSPTTLWLRMPSFQDDQYKPLKALLEAHRDELAKTPNLLIDLRDNGGGSDFVYEALLPLLYTRPIYSIGVEMRASADNLMLRRELATKLRSQVPETARLLDAENIKMAKHMGTYFSPSDKPFSIQKFNHILPFPKRVAVLIDGAGSTGEQFLLDARQSHKVTLFGQRNSAGVLDFANVVGKRLPSGRYRLAWATSRSLRLPDDPVDDGGIRPDVRIPANESDPVSFISDWLGRQTD